MVSIILFFLAASTSVFATNISDCAVLNQTGTTYVLTSDITGSGGIIQSGGYWNGYDVCIMVSSTNVTLDCQGHQINGNGDEGIATEAGSDNVVIKNCNISGWNDYGIYMYQANNAIISNTSVDSTSGIELDYSNVTTVSNDYMINTNAGLELDDGSHGTVVQNSVLSGNVGMYDSIPCDDEFSNVTGSGNLPIIFYNSTVSISDWNNNVSELILCNANNSTINNVNLSGIGTIRLFLIGTSGTAIKNSIFNNDSGAVLMYYGSTSNTVYNTTFIGDAGTALTLFWDSSDNNTVYNNTFISNWRGIGLYSSYNKIHDNVIQDSTNVSIRLRTQPDGVAIKGNLIYNNLLNNSVNILVYDVTSGNFYNTTEQSGTRIYSSGNQIGGNYWTNSTGNGYSDTCIDANKDGFCDAPYDILGNDSIYDSLPLSDVTSCTGKPNGTACDDGLFCTVNDQCSSGVCGGSPRDCSLNNLAGIATCFNIPDNYSFTWDFRNAFTSSCQETENNTGSCTLGNGTITHTCSVANCSAECDSIHSCNDKCVGNVKYYSGNCLSTCNCSYSIKNCDLQDGWYNTTNTQWINTTECSEKEQVQQEYRDYSCSLTANCNYTVNDTKWIDTGNKTDNCTLLADGQSCNSSSDCNSTNCAVDYDGSGNWCAPSDNCAHKADITRASGSTDCYNSNKEICNSSIWIPTSCPYGCSSGNCNSAPAPQYNGGGGGGGGFPVTCKENWTCAEWSNCIAGKQTRVCSDKNKCGTTKSKPAESQTCITPSQKILCVEDWSCNDWSSCVNNTQTRTCADKNNCGTTNKPVESQTCSLEKAPSSAAATTAPTGFFLGLNTTEWMTAIVASIIVACVIIYGILKVKKKKTVAPAQTAPITSTQST